MNKKPKGFTLIELLVVIAIIGLLASIVAVAVNSARKKARDTKRMSDIVQLQKALEMYYYDYNSYPNITQSADNVHCNPGGPPPPPTLDTYLGSYISSIPHDPLGPPSVDWGSRYCYFYNVKKGGEGYVIMAYQVESPETAAKGEGSSCYPDTINVYCKGQNY